MDQAKIGRFIAECRKNKNLTQAQLAEKLNITDRAVSKWETGRAMPDSSIMLALCDVLSITVNDLLCGEKIIMENSNQKNEQLLLEMAKELERKNKTIWTSMWAIMIVSMTALFAGILIAAFLNTRRNMANCHNSRCLRCIFDTLLLCVKAGSKCRRLQV